MGVFPVSDPPSGGTLLLGEEGPKSCPGGLTDHLGLVAAVPLPAMRDPMATQSPVEGNAMSSRKRTLRCTVSWSDPDVVGAPAVVAMVGMNALPIKNDAPLDCGDGDTAWIAHNGYRCEIVDGMTVYYGGNLCDSDESDWEDPYDIASQQYVDDYNFDALFRAVMSLVHDWAEWSVWTGTISGYCRTITWEVGYLPRLHPPCDVDRLCDYMAWQIKGPVVLIRTDMDENNSPQRCACTRGTSLGVLSAGRILIMAIVRIDCGSGPRDCSDWTRVRGVVDFSPGGVRIGYIREALCDRSSTDTAPVTRSLVFSALLDSLDIYCTAEFASCRLFCGTDCVWLAGSGLSFRRVSVCRTMATEGAALVENRAGITFGVELYVSWDAPKAVVDIHSEGVVPLRSIPDVIGLAGRRSDAAECRILQGRDVRSVRVLVPDPVGPGSEFS